MAPRNDHHHPEDFDELHDHHPHFHRLDYTLLEMASSELERIRIDEVNGLLPISNSSQHSMQFMHFPPACLAVLKTIPGNHRCIDCGAHDPQWAAVSYGALLCLACSGRHRSLGVQVSCVRSITMDSWSQQEILSMLEGGNDQLATFFQRHALCPSPTTSPTSSSSLPDGKMTTTIATTTTTTTSPIHNGNVTQIRYKTKAALFYRQQLLVHVRTIMNAGPYRGREAARRQWRRCQTTVA